MRTVCFAVGGKVEIPDATVPLNGTLSHQVAVHVVRKTRLRVGEYFVHVSAGGLGGYVQLAKSGERITFIVR